MTWVRFDDGFPEHRKVMPLSDAAFRLHVQAICWSARHLTDGRVAQRELGTVTRMRKPDRVVAELVARGNWHEAGQGCDSEYCPSHPKYADASLDASVGWVIHDYWDFQPSKEKVNRERRDKAERQKRWLERRGKGSGKRDASQDASVDTSKDAAPYPPRPAPKEGGGGAPQHSPPASGAGAAGRAHPSGSPGRAEQDNPHGPMQAHDFTDDGNGTCNKCHLPAANRAHTGGEP